MTSPSNQNLAPAGSETSALLAPSDHSLVTPDAQLVVVANRLPVRPSSSPGEEGWMPSPGGLVSALTSILQNQNGLWIGWPGASDYDAPPATFEEKIRGQHRRDAHAALFTEAPHAGEAVSSAEYAAQHHSTELIGEALVEKSVRGGRALAALLGAHRVPHS